MGLGFITLHRSIMDCWVWNQKPFGMGQAWVDLIMLANFTDKKAYSGGELKLFKRGTVHMSIQALAERWGWDRKKVRTFLRALEEDNMVTVESTTHGTTVTLVKYEDFNNQGTTKAPTEGQPIPQPKDNNYPDNSPQLNKDNNGNNDKQGKKVFVPPTIEEVSEYCRERGNTVDPERFIDFYSAKGWMVGKNKMKDWRAAVRTWESSDYRSAPQPTFKPKPKNPFLERSDMSDLDRIEQGALWEGIK